MVSTKGKPTEPKLKERVTEKVKQQTNKDGSGKGKMAAWKAAKIGKEYEARGGDYEDVPGSKNKAQKGPPEKKSAAQKEDGTAIERPSGSGSGERRKKEKKEKEPRKGTRSSARQRRVEAGAEGGKYESGTAKVKEKKKEEKKSSSDAGDSDETETAVVERPKTKKKGKRKSVADSDEPETEIIEEEVHTKAKKAKTSEKKK
ncbi:hypothetical protein V494_00421 [Pseudogymnoascus sp. VKM F-4513 (FW-928)]|nr:hypothetical protein V490_00009 [Pseudogymnoascus sp. VKM F-3557]KFY46573.1 hypothetical protein V494_00421 [Pseudogymnoascus sp. VKM F-4513 (FW-928)]